MANTQTALQTQQAEKWLMPKMESSSRYPSTLTPPVDIYEDDQGIVLLADMPGVRKNTLSISFEHNELAIEGEVALNIPDNSQPIFAEMNSRRYARSFTLSRELNGDKIQADLKNGVLRVTIPKDEAFKPRKIDISTP